MKKFQSATTSVVVRWQGGGQRALGHPGPVLRGAQRMGAAGSHRAVRQRQQPIPGGPHGQEGPHAGAAQLAMEVRHFLFSAIFTSPPVTFQYPDCS